MTPPRTPIGNELIAMAEKQGETYATVREIKHTVNNMAMQFPQLITMVSIVETLSRDRDDHEKRLAVLEADKHRREGAVGLVEWISKHWPFTVILAATAFLWALVEGKLR